MPESLVITCPDHQCPLLPSPADPVMLYCPEGDCDTSVRISAPEAAVFPASPLTHLEQGAVQHHELVRAHEAAGFSRSEGMQVLCCIISASIMKGGGNG